MKIFNKENGINKVYVQLDDLLVLYNSDAVIPSSIFDKVFLDGFTIDDNNRYDFIEFTDQDEIDFFKAIDWIVDYKDLKDKNKDELRHLYDSCIADLNSNCLGINGCDELNSSDYESYNHRAKSILDFYNVKYGNMEYPFPQVPYSEGTFLDDSDNSGYIISESITPGTVLLYKKNGDILKGTDSIYPSTINGFISILTLKEEEQDRLFFDYRANYSISDDCKYLVIKYKNKINNIFKKEQPIEEPKKRNKLFSKVFKKKR